MSVLQAMRVIQWACWLCLAAATVKAADVPAAVLQAEAERVQTVARICQPTIAVFSPAGEGGGSGVLISPEGYALTNFHVTASCGAAMQCGMSNGELYDAVLVGLDPPGDVALIQLLGRDDFPTAELGDSDAARVGDWVYVVGNPFLLAEDYRPTVTYGILSGTHRYQYPAGTLLEYADCLQTDASINPGNSGGPLFNSAGQLIGLNGRGSFEKRGRVNVGVGYAISINQIRLFLSHLKSGRIVDHATLGATVSSVRNGRVVVDDVLVDGDAYRRGLRYGDQVMKFGGREITSANALKNALGIYPSGWRVPMEWRRDDANGTDEEVVSRSVRLASLHAAGELESLLEQQEQEPVPSEPEPPPEGEPKKRPPQPRPKSPASEEVELPARVKAVYEEREGYANYWFNRQHQERIVAHCRQLQSLAAEEPFVVQGTDAAGDQVLLQCDTQQGSYRSPRGQFFARYDQALDTQRTPPGSGGLLVAADQWRRWLAEGPSAFGEVYYLGQLPVGETQRLRDCLVAIDQGIKTHFYFDLETGDLVAMELFLTDDADPCAIYFSDFRPWQAGSLPFTWQVRQGDATYVQLTVQHYQQPSAEEAADE